MLKFTGDYIKFFGGIQMVYFTRKAWDKLARKFVAVRINSRKEPSKMYILFTYRSVLGKAHKADGDMKKNIDKTVSFYEMTGEKSAPNKDNVYFLVFPMQSSLRLSLQKYWKERDWYLSV